MARSMPFRHQITEIVNWNQIKALNDTLFILRNIGPVGFIIQEEGSDKKYKVCLGDPHNCTCKNFRAEKDLCKHICWVLLKKFKVDRNDPIGWQLGLVQREINDLIFTKRAIINKTQKENIIEEINDDNDKLQRKIEVDDVCPICQDDLINAHKPVTFCRHGCGNNVHIRCMAVWSEHKKKELNLKMQDSIPCPICRGEFGTLQILLVEMTNSRDSKFKKKRTISIKHTGFICSNCNENPITGKAYKCISCSYYFLCGKCFNEDVHNIHNFLFRDCSNGKWLEAPLTRGLPISVINGLQSNDLETADYNFLQQLDRSGEGSSLRQQDINRFPSWIILSKSKLIQPGHQCRICLMSYKEGDSVRKLPFCQHIFHTLCIDPWLLHRTQRCPIDNIEIPRMLCSIQSQNSLVSASENKLSEKYNDFKNQSKDLLSTLSIASFGCRQSSSSNLSKASRNFTSNISRSASNKAHLPPIANNKQNYNISLAITSLRLHQNGPS